MAAQDAAQALWALQQILTRDDIMEVQKVHKMGNVNAWAAGTRYDYLIAAANGEHKSWETLLKRIDTIFANPRARDVWKTKPECYISVTLDHARAYMHCGKPAEARKTLTFLLSQPNIKHCAQFWKAVIIAEAQLGDAAKVRRFIDSTRANLHSEEWHRTIDSVLASGSPDALSAISSMAYDDLSFPWREEMVSESATLKRAGGASGSAPTLRVDSLSSVPVPVVAPSLTSRSLLPRRTSTFAPSSFISSLSPVREDRARGQGARQSSVQVDREQDEEEDGDTKTGSRSRPVSASHVHTVGMDATGLSGASSSSSSSLSGLSASSTASTGHGAHTAALGMTTVSASTRGHTGSATLTAPMSGLAMSQLDASTMQAQAVREWNGTTAGKQGMGKGQTCTAAPAPAAPSFTVPDYIRSFNPGARCGSAASAPVSGLGMPSSRSPLLSLDESMASPGGDGEGTVVLQKGGKAQQGTARRGAKAGTVAPPIAYTTSPVESSPVAAGDDGSTVILQPQARVTAVVARAAPAPAPPSSLDESSFDADDSADGPSPHVPAMASRQASVRAAPAPAQRVVLAAVKAPSIPAYPSNDEAAEVTPEPMHMSGGTPFHSLPSTHEVVRVGAHTYLRLACIGRGGSSRVYRVLGEDMCTYALKRVRLSRMDPVAVEPYKNEIALLKKLGCGPSARHIIRMVDAEIDWSGRCIHMVMEYGQADLNTVLATERERVAATAAASGSCSPVMCVDENVLRVTWAQMLAGVQAIHEARVVHGDLKPANFVFVEGVLKLIDFGIAKALRDDTTNIVRDAQMGTLNYMSPEAIQDVSAAGVGGMGMRAPVLKLGRASDIWSLGCILFQMVYGRTPFADLPLIPKLHAICDVNSPIPFPTGPAGDPGNPDLVDVLTSCLQRDAARRPAIAGPSGLLEHPFLRPRSRVVEVRVPVLAAHPAGSTVLGPGALHAIVDGLAGLPKGGADGLLARLASMQSISAHAVAEEVQAVRASLPTLPPLPLHVNGQGRAMGALSGVGAAIAAAATARAGREKAEGEENSLPGAARTALGSKATPLARPAAVPGRSVSVGRQVACGADLQAALAGLKKVPVADKENIPAGDKGVGKADGLVGVLRRGLETRFARVFEGQGDDTSVGPDATWS